ncbi:MAG: tRNA (N(6)-L-threonylcarbamoyladenosine(37)-C(2))-methylthiotransferase MtaB [Firmicutes bacterium]|nr:tRNA (N(6)-L-threonylcarbamoyladenosine(37)-C(2))-methylthiotransferase MtaB [Bacillota bacterium]
MTLGCKVNAYETQAVAGMFRRRGYRIVGFDEEADVYVINTCSVTSTGARKSRQMIRRAIRRNPQAIVVAMGCHTQEAAEEVAGIPGVDVVVGTDGRRRIVDLVEEVMVTGQPVNAVSRVGRSRDYEEIPATHIEGKARAVIKVQDGCDEFCSYCVIPRLRGRSRSRLSHHVLQEAQDLVAEGYGEIVLTGVHLGAYGADLDPPITVVDLVRAVGSIPGLLRLRLSSLDPHEISDELIEVIAGNPRICRHLHIPAQAGDDAILRAMRRRNTTADYFRLVERLRGALPGIAITTDIIVGFPGETEADFQATYEFCRAIGFSKIHVFPYSRRRGTRAATMEGQVEAAVKKARAQRLLELSDTLALSYHQTLVGKPLEVLIEAPSDKYANYMQGLTDTYVRVHMPAGRITEPGAMVEVVAAVAFSDGLRANEMPILKKCNRNMGKNQHQAGGCTFPAKGD